ncbi:unnamed protein product, partial [Trichogramma brassicae]
MFRYNECYILADCYWAGNFRCFGSGPLEKDYKLETAKTWRLTHYRSQISWTRCNSTRRPSGPPCTPEKFSKQAARNEKTHRRPERRGEKGRGISFVFLWGRRCAFTETELSRCPNVEPEFFLVPLKASDAPLRENTFSVNGLIRELVFRWLHHDLKPLGGLVLKHERRLLSGSLGPLSPRQCHSSRLDPLPTCTDFSRSACPVLTAPGIGHEQKRTCRNSPHCASSTTSPSVLVRSPGCSVASESRRWPRACVEDGGGGKAKEKKRRESNDGYLFEYDSGVTSPSRDSIDLLVARRASESAGRLPLLSGTCRAVHDCAWPAYEDFESQAQSCTALHVPERRGKRPADSLARRATSRSIESRDGDVTPESYSNKYPSFDSRRFFSFAFPPPPSSTHARGHRRDSDATEQPGSAPTLELEIQLFEVLLKIQNERYSGRIDESGAVITDVNVSHAADRLDDGLEDVHSGTAASQTAVVQFSTHNKTESGCAVSCTPLRSVSQKLSGQCGDVDEAQCGEFRHVLFVRGPIPGAVSTGHADLEKSVHVAEDPDESYGIDEVTEGQVNRIVVVATDRFDPEEQAEGLALFCCASDDPRRRHLTVTSSNKRTNLCVVPDAVSPGDDHAKEGKQEESDPDATNDVAKLTVVRRKRCLLFCHRSETRSEGQGEACRDEGTRCRCTRTACITPLTLNAQLCLTCVKFSKVPSAAGWRLVGNSVAVRSASEIFQYWISTKAICFLIIFAWRVYNFNVVLRYTSQRSI